MDTALVSASRNGEKDKVTILLAMGARVDAREHGFTPLLVAAQFGHKDVCELLLANGSDLEERMPDTLGTALHFAAGYGHQSLLDLLLFHKADVNSRTRTGSTPLHCASQAGHFASVVALLQAGADPMLPNDQGALPIHVAAQNNQPEVVRVGIEQGGCSIDQVRNSVQSICFSFISFYAPLIFTNYTKNTINVLIIILFINHHHYINIFILPSIATNTKSLVQQSHHYKRYEVMYTGFG